MNRQRMGWIFVAMLGLLLQLPCSFCSAQATDSQSDILLSFRSNLADTDGFLKNWSRRNASSVCDWNGISCDDSGIVTGIDLQSMNLGGNFSDAFCSLPKLSELNLANNNINQSLEGLRFSGCRSLGTLNLSMNYIFGGVPDTLSELISLRVLDLSSLYLEGPIPTALSKMSGLKWLDLGFNFLSGAIPADLGELSSLEYLNLAENSLSGPNSIPAELGKLQRLQNLQLQRCSMTGTIPASLGNMSSLVLLQLSENNLTGPIPASLGRLVRLRYLQAYENHLTGPIPSQIWNLSSLLQLDLATNNLSGTIPEGISALKQLQMLHLYENQLEGSIPRGLSSITTLSYVLLFQNRFTGKLSANLGNNSMYRAFEVSENDLEGPVPANLCNGNVLQNLSLHTNRFEGQIHPNYGSCSSLVRLQMHNNRLSGELPAGIWSAPNLTIIKLENNFFSGSIPSEVSKAQQLAQILIDNNRFSGQFPKELDQLPNLYKLSASQNGFSGSFPASICVCPILSSINVSHNSLSGHMPGFSGCNNLVLIAFASNHLTGQIPATLGTLPVLTYIDLSYNNLTGSIPSQLVNRKIVLLNLSYNSLSGKVPDSLTSPALDLSGNPGLCGDGLPKSCNSRNNPTSRSSQNHHLIWILVAAFAAAGLMLAIGVILIHRSCNRETYFQRKSEWNTVAFFHLGFNEDEISEKLEDSNLVGSGASGKVYKVILPGGDAVAVKKLWKAAKICSRQRQSASIRTEIETLGKVRHRNIVKLLCCCSNEETTLLVYEYLPKGSLARALHSPGIDGVLQWPTRFKIALGTARGLAYLHHDFVPQILHRDIKSNNILLDYDCEPKIADFGLAKILGDVGHVQSMSMVVGSYGYMAPEHAYTPKVDAKIDVYSYGVVLMELVTGRRAVEVEAGELIDVVKWVRGKVNTKDGITKVLDGRIVMDQFKQEMVSTLKVALLCTSVLPQRRPSMREVVEMLELVSSSESPQQKLFSLEPLFIHSSSTRSSP